jgi:hypothetical protein
MELSRRRFMQFLSAAPVALAFDPHRKIFDMGRSQIWTPPPPEIIEGVELGPYVMQSINAVVPIIFARLINGNREQEFLRKIDAIASR